MLRALSTSAEAGKRPGIRVARIPALQLLEVKHAPPLE